VGRVTAYSLLPEELKAAGFTASVDPLRLDKEKKIPEGGKKEENMQTDRKKIFRG